MKKSKLFLILSVTFALLALTQFGLTQTVTPPNINLDNASNVCSGGSETIPVSITLPPGSVVDKVDVMLLFDDTGSFAGFVPTVTSIFSSLVGTLEATVPGVEFGFGVARFEDYGGPGTGFSFEVSTGRPFILNQPIITAADAGGAAARDALIGAALSRTAPGFGGDGPESAIAEGLFQLATGVGFDGDGDGSTLGSGVAGAVSTQTSPGTTGDVPEFASNIALTSGSLGGAGWRPGALHLVILATDICAIATFPPGPIPANITGAGGSSEPVTAFACNSIIPGSQRFGYVSDSKTLAGNTVPGAVAPAGAATVQGTIDALNALGVRVLGMGPGAGPTNNPGPSFDESVFLSALARLTGAVDNTDTPLVFSTSVSPSALADAIANAIATSTTADVDITLDTSALPAGLSFSFTPPIVPNVSPGGTASFDVTLTGDGSAISGSFDINFIDEGSGAVLGTIPTTITCSISTDTNAPVCDLTGFDPGPPLSVQFSLVDTESGIKTVRVEKLSNATVEIPEGSGNFYNQGDVVTFSPPETAPILVRAAKIDNGSGASIILEVTDDAGNSVMCDPVYTTLSSITPEGFDLQQNYPNPFNPTTTIHFNVASSNNGSSPVSIRIYDVSGREIKTLLNEDMAPGEYSVEWDGTNNTGQKVAGGMYIYRMVAGDFTATKKMIFMK